MGTQNTVDIVTFVEGHLQPPPGHVLEVGCGEGDLARAVARLRYDIVAIDPQAPEGEFFERVSLEEFTGSGPFDAVLATRALHHIPNLGYALDKVARLLRPGGRLIVHEHAWERMDERTARWYLERRPTDSSGIESFLAEWNADHAGLHGYAELRAELDQRFEQRYFARTPYLHAELGGTEVEREERDLIDAGQITATGFNYVGETRTRG